MSMLLLKICGMKSNVSEVAALQPDYLGFIFYDKSPRNVVHVPSIPQSIKKVGVFVDATIAFILEKASTYQLEIIQLHGNETPQFCNRLKEESKSVLGRPLELWKVFGIKDTFDFGRLLPFERIVDKFLFDTKGPSKGGNGYTFNWEILKNYSSQKPLILSGGIGIEEISKVKELLQEDIPLHAIDVNSKFEEAPGKKNITLLQQLNDELQR